VQDHNAQQARRSLDEDDTDAPCIAETWSNYHFAQFKTVHPPSQPECLKKIDQNLQSLIFRRNNSPQKNIHKLIVSFTRVVFFHQLSAEKVFSGQWND